MNGISLSDFRNVEDTQEIEEIDNSVILLDKKVKKSPAYHN